MKCSGIRWVRGKALLCGKRVDADYEAFCSYEHQQEARKYTAASYDQHILRFKHVVSRKPLHDAYNSKIRPAFASIIEARMKQEQEEFMSVVGSEYAEGAKNAWKSLETFIVSSNAEKLQNDFKELCETKKAMKRQYDTTVDLATALYKRRTTSFDEELAQSDDAAECSVSHGSKRPKSSGCDTSRSKDKRAELQRAVNTPLPCAGDSDELLND